MARTQVVGLDKFRTGLGVAMAKQRTGITRAMRDTAAAVVQALKAACPVKTGALRDSIRAVEVSPSRIEIWIGDRNAFYGPHVEFDTSRAPAHPFVRPVIEQYRKDFPGRIDEILTENWTGP